MLEVPPAGAERSLYLELTELMGHQCTMAETKDETQGSFIGLQLKEGTHLDGSVRTSGDGNRATASGGARRWSSMRHLDAPAQRRLVPYWEADRGRRMALSSVPMVWAT